MLGSPVAVIVWSWGCLGELRGTFGSHGKRLLRSESDFLVILGILVWRLGSPFSHGNEDLDAAIATYSFRMFLGLGLDFVL